MKFPHYRNRLHAMLAFCSTAGIAGADAVRYEVAFASFAPINADIFVAEGDGGGAKPLLPHPGFDGNASFTKDGRWIVFTSERGGSYDIYRARPDGSDLERLVDHPAYDDQASLSPDGKSLAFVSARSGQADIWIMELATKRTWNLTQHPAGDFRPSWSPDGAWIAFSSDRDSKKTIGVSGFVTTHSTALFVVKRDGSELRRLTRADGFAGSPSWSEDGKRIFFHEAEITEVTKITTVRKESRGTTQITAVDIATGETHTLTQGFGEKWSPRSVALGRVAYVSGRPDGGVDYVGGKKGARGEFRNANWDDRGQRMIFHRDVDASWPPFLRWHTMDPQFQIVRTGVFPSYSPIDDTIVCSDAASGLQSKKLVTMSRDGRDRKVFFSGGEKGVVGAAFSPDGKLVSFSYGQFFQTVNGPAVADIAVINRDGSDLRLLTDGSGNCGFQSWSPDGREIVYRSSGGKSDGLFIINVESRKVRPLTTGANRDNFPAWSPKGDRIAFTSFRDADYEIYTVNIDGSDVRRITSSPGNDAHSVWSPDGEWLAFTSARGGFKDESILSPHNAQPYGDIYVVRPDGSDVRQLTDTPFEEGTVAWAPMRRQ